MNRIRQVVIVLAAFAWSSPMIDGAPQSPSPGAKTGPYKGFGYPWENNDLGIDRTVPKPWTPVEVEGKTLRVWGRSFQYGKGVLPEQIVTQGQELFHRAPVVALSLNGRALDLAGAEPVIENDGVGDRVSIRWRNESGGAGRLGSTAPASASSSHPTISGCSRWSDGVVRGTGRGTARFARSSRVDPPPARRQTPSGETTFLSKGAREIP